MNYKMNAYEKVEIHKKPEFAEHLKKAEALDVNLFDKEKILRFAEKYDIMADDVKKKVLEALCEIKEDEAYKKIAKAIYYFIKNCLPIDDLKPDFEEGIKAEFVEFFPVWYSAEEYADDKERRGISKEIIIKSLSEICGFIKANEEVIGRMGTSSYFHWLSVHGQGKLFRINEFMYELAMHNEKNAVGIHIPPKTRLNVYENLKSFREAMEFFDKYYPELEMTGLICESWLLSREIEEVMGGSTNITRFGDMFDRYDVGDTKGESVFWRVYNIAGVPPIETLPENTTMQKRMKEYMLSGKRVYACGGFISREKLYSRLREFEV